MLGLDDDEYKALDDEIELLVKTKSQLKERVRELPDAVIQSQASATEGQGSEEQQAGEDPTGQSAWTMVNRGLSVVGCSWSVVARCAT